MQNRIEILTPKKLVGKYLTMSFLNNRTGELWQSFMPHRKKITNVVNSNLFSLQVYPKGFDFGLATEFEKWALAEVTNFEEIPENMEAFNLNGGLYAVFLYKGSSLDFQKPFQYIFGTWLPNSGYELDDRPHFELLGEKYKNNDPNSEEEIWIPIKVRA